MSILHNKWLLPVWVLGLSQAYGSSFIAESTATMDGTVDSGYTLLNESTFANTAGGQAGASDLPNEASGRNRWNGSSNEDIGTDGSAPRGDIQAIYSTWDRNNLYLAVVGPTLQLNSFSNVGGTPGINGDQGDVFIAIDTAVGRNVAASGSLASDSGWGSNATASNFGGTDEAKARAVDFSGWTPDFVVAVQYVNNGGGGTGHAEIVNLGTSGVTSEGQNLADGGFDWHSNMGNTLEFQIPWSLLGFAVDFDPTTPADIGTIRLTAYTTGNLGGFDVFDQGPGIGQGSLYEQLGDKPGDEDTAGQLGEADGGSIPGGSLAGSNFVFSSPSSSVGFSDQIDTIGGNLSFNVGSIPEPQTLTMALFGLLCLRFFRRHTQG